MKSIHVKNVTSIFTALAFLIAATKPASGQTLQDAVKKTMNERYESAASDFRILIQAQPASAEVFFDAADNYFYWEELDSSSLILTQAAAFAPNNPLVLMGQGRLDYFQGNTGAGLALFDKAVAAMTVKGSGLDKSQQQLVYIKMAEVLIGAEKKDLVRAEQYIQAAIKLGDDNPEVHIQWGDLLLEEEAMNRAPVIDQYEKAYEINPLYTRALLRQGQLWMRVESYELAEEWFKKAIDNDPTFAPAYRELAELLYKTKRTREAKTSYEEYLKLNDSPSARGRYIRFLHILKEYKLVLEEGDKLLRRDSSDAKIYRLCGYAAFEVGDYPKGLSYMDRFVSRVREDGKPDFIYYDYAYLGKLQSKAGKDSLALVNMNLAIGMKPEDPSLYSDLAAIYVKMKRYTEAAANYEKKIGMTEKVDPLDRSGLGQVYYRMAEAIKDTTLAAEKMAFYQKADTQFGLIVDSYPIFANAWRGKINSKLDNQEAPAGLAKPFYEQVIVKVGPDPTSVEKNKKELIEGYSYLGFLYFTQKNFNCSKSAWMRVQELDPANEKAKAALSDKDISSVAGDCTLIAQ